MSDAIRFGIVGFGNIGSGVVDVFTRNRDVINARLPRPLELVRLADKDLTTPRPVEVPPGVEFTGDADRLLRGEDIDIVVELVGGLSPARKFVETALRAGKHVVTANKALLADCGAELWALAAKSGVSLLFEASVGGGIPVIRTLQQGLSANRLTSIRGILNGTCNYVLSNMASGGVKYADALSEAQRLGYAEPDPTYDVEGYDTAHKMAILASLAFGQDIRFSDVAVEGITKVRAEDLALAAERQCALKLLGIARCDGLGEPVEVSVQPTLIPRRLPLGGVDGVLNAVEIVGDAVGLVLLVGPGAGPEPTASAVLSDVMNLAQQIVDGGAPLDRRLKVPPGVRRVRPAPELMSAQCLNLSLLDNAGARQKVLSALAAEEIGVEEVVERGRREGEYLKLAIFTERAAGTRVQAALSRIAGEKITLEPPSAHRVESMS
jgi:homoserine dehydrogenase